ncbi:hypothetical protein H0H93_005047 [Arthromyces matolae]|nr:hypothetical protein H0H93_005047 [Arthromyces matolae]
MVHLFLFNPVSKLRCLSELLSKQSNRLLKSLSKATHSQTKQIFSPPSVQQCTPYHQVPQAVENSIGPENELSRDPEYCRDSGNGFCAFRVENTLFNLNSGRQVHQVVLSREPSAFDDMLRLPRSTTDADSGHIENPVLLTDTVLQFRDFLWALYAPPNDLFNETNVDRLLNIAAVCNKYCLSSLETFTIERIYSLAKTPNSTLPLHSFPLDVCARILDLAILCDHQLLEDLMMQILISRTLWYDAPPEAVLRIAEKHNLRTLIGVCSYRQLVSFERSSSDKNDRGQTLFTGPSDDVEKGMCFLAAHTSLLALWERIRAVPPTLSCQGCPAHVDCDRAWQTMWYSACKTDEMLRGGSADVLGRMKALMLGLRRAMAATPTMSIQCKMAALEAITETRDMVIEGLITHFTKPTS